jgi:hypothetical protein
MVRNGVFGGKNSIFQSGHEGAYSILVVSPHLLSLQKIEQGGGYLLARIFFSRTNQL